MMLMALLRASGPRRLPTASPLSSALSSSWMLSFPCSNSNHQRQQSASYWMDVVRVKTDKNGRRRHEDPERVVMRHREERRSDGEALLDLHFYNDRHEKNWMRRKRLQDKRRYEFDKKHVTDLAKYIAFVQDNKAK
mmetsp:Transcript_30715/g.57502  ORF Transcript_30715/g.57502 Transcript_30715/m.57502 type:complete len:136 (-) Transcript_30715:290-697(-)